MNASNQKNDWLSSWLETQRNWLQRWTQASDEQRVDAVRESMEAFRKQMTGPATPEALGVLQKFQELLQTGFAGSLEWTRSIAEPPAEQGDTGFSWQQLLHAFPLGHAREQQTAWQELARAHAEHQLQAQELAQAFGKVIAVALEAVPQQVELRAQQGQPLKGYRELYDLWIEQGEREFAQLAHDERFAQLQAHFGNAQLRLRRAQQRIVEYALKQLDLPTRAELNTVHQRLRELTARVAALENQRELQEKNQEKNQEKSPKSARPKRSPVKNRSA